VRRLADTAIPTMSGSEGGAPHIPAGVTHHDVTVNRNMTDNVMVRILARENATQRGNMGTARIGSVAAALKIVVMSEYDADVQNQNIKPNYQEFARGIGWRAIEKKLEGVPGHTLHTINADLAALRASGLYTEIINGAQAEIDAKVAAIATPRAL
jgi:hypothetical protein